MEALIDGDILVYRIGFAVQKKVGGDLVVEPPTHAFYLVKKSITSILKGCNAKQYRLFLTSNDKSNYRFLLAKTLRYKANRVQDKPFYYNDIREYMINWWGAEVVSGREADDEMGIAQVQSKSSTIICSIDKDMLMVPGLHYRFVDGTTYRFEDPGELFAHKKDKILGGGLKWFYAQMLMGDTADNIPGLKGIGPKKALKLLQNIDTEEEMIYTVKKAYEEHKVLDRFDEVADLLWIQREEGVKYTDRGL